MNCTRCDGTGFLNLHQVDDATLKHFYETGEHGIIAAWIEEREARRESAGGCCSCHINPPCAFCETSHDVSVCDCCGDGENWYGEPGQHDLNDKSAPFPQCY